MATTSLGSATTQMTDVSRLGSWQTGHRPSPSEKFWHTGQQWMAAFAPTMASAKAAASPPAGRGRRRPAAGRSCGRCRGAGRTAPPAFPGREGSTAWVSPPQGGDGRRRLGRAVHRRAGHQGVRTGGHDRRGRLGVDPAVHLQAAGGVIPLNEGAHLADGVQLVLQKGLAAEAGLHRHHQHHVQPLQVGEHGGGAVMGRRATALSPCRPPSAAGPRRCRWGGRPPGGRRGDPPPPGQRPPHSAPACRSSGARPETCRCICGWTAPPARQW